MSPYRFSFVRILLGIYLIVQYNLYGQKSELSGSQFVYIGLTTIAVLFTLGYQRQLLARSLAFFTYLLFAFEKVLLEFNSISLLFLLLFFGLVAGHEPWRLLSKTEKVEKFEAKRVFLYLIFVWLWAGTAVVLTYAFDLLKAPDFSHGSIWILIFVLAILSFPKFVFRAKAEAPSPILFFDGVCGLCSNFVDFVFSEDIQSIYKVATLQGKTALEKVPADLRENLSTMVVLSHDQKIYKKSEAVLNVLYDIGGFWRLLFIFRLIPRPVCDLFYNVIVRFRYRIFGKRETCRLPTEAERQKFLD